MSSTALHISKCNDQQYQNKNCTNTTLNRNRHVDYHSLCVLARKYSGVKYIFGMHGHLTLKGKHSSSEAYFEACRLRYRIRITSKYIRSIFTTDNGEREVQGRAKIEKLGKGCFLDFSECFYFQVETHRLHALAVQISSQRSACYCEPESRRVDLTTTPRGRGCV